MQSAHLSVALPVSRSLGFCPTAGHPFIPLTRPSFLPWPFLFNPGLPGSLDSPFLHLRPPILLRTSFLPLLRLEPWHPGLCLGTVSQTPHSPQCPAQASANTQGHTLSRHTGSPETFSSRPEHPQCLPGQLGAARKLGVGCRGHRERIPDSQEEDNPIPSLHTPSRTPHIWFAPLHDGFGPFYLNCLPWEPVATWALLGV